MSGICTLFYSAYRAYGQYDSLHSAIVTDFHCPSSNTYYYDPSHGIDDCTGIGFGKINYCYEKLYIECGTYRSAAYAWS